MVHVSWLAWELLGATLDGGSGWEEEGLVSSQTAAP